MRKSPAPPPGLTTRAASFAGTRGPDLYFKIIIDIIAVLLMIALGSKLKRQPV
jgi:hypothetical protein